MDMEKNNFDYHVLSIVKLFSSSQILNSTQQWSEKKVNKSYIYKSFNIWQYVVSNLHGTSFLFFTSLEVNNGPKSGNKVLY